jgi:anti-sigma B factor antagonist
MTMASTTPLQPELVDQEPPMKIHTEHHESVAVVRPIGRFSGATLDFLLRDAVTAVIAGGSRQVIVDLADLASIDSSGVGELVSAYAAARNRGASLELARPTREVHDTLAASRLRTIFAVHPTLDIAIAAAANRDSVGEKRG